MTQRTPGLCYRKLDLHVHTPASQCFDNKSITPEEIISKALEQELDAIAITDHNTGESIDKIKNAAKNKIIVFPGVEISSSGGEKTVHIIGILDESKGTKDIENLLGDLKIKADKYGKEEAYTEFSPNQVIDKIFDHGGLAVLAHANTAQGVLGGMKGNPRIEIIKNPNLFAAEATDFENSEKKKKKTRVIDLLDGTHSAYRKLAVYQASDNPSKLNDGKHSLNGIGSKYTYFKLDEITLEGLRQCFCDPDVRIQQNDELETKKYPRIMSLEISQGFLKGKKFTFHEGLNSVVGGKGVGKSLLIELLRFGLCQPSQDRSISMDHQEKLRKRLEPLATVTIYIELENGEQYKIVKTYDGVDNRIKSINLQTEELYDGDIVSLLPILAYSQNEVIKIAEDEESQLRLIDSFIDTTSYLENLKSLSRDLMKKDKELAQCIKASSEVASLRIDLSTVNEQLKNIDRSLKDKLFEEVKVWEQKKLVIEQSITYLDTLLGIVDNAIRDYKNEKNNNKQLPFKDPSFKKTKRLCDESYSKALTYLEQAKDTIKRNKEELSNSFIKFMVKFNKKLSQYETMLEKVGGDKRKLEAERRRLLKRKEQIDRSLSKYTKQLYNLKVVRSNRDSLLDKFEKVYSDYYILRKQQFDNLTSQSKGKLQLVLNHAANKTQFQTELLNLRKGSRIREADIEKVVENLMPREFIELVIDNKIDLLVNKVKLAPENGKKLIDTLNSKEALEEVLKLSHSVYPKDVPSIEFLKEDGKFYPLAELSVGQKCTALLIIALSEGSKPVIIDQPEDSLDNPSVYEDIVSKLRLGKKQRQFIITTHNSSVGVASDSDNFVILSSTANQGEVKCSGAIDRKGVRTEIIRHLEGGKEPYKLKHKKYNISEKEE